MSDAPDDDLSLSQLRKIDEICDRFEADLRAGVDVKVEDYLREIDEAARAALQRELDALLAQYSGAGGDEPTAFEPTAAHVPEQADCSIEATTPMDSATREDALRPTEAFTLRSAEGSGQRYTVLRPHAEGGLGRVSVARDEELHREVAFKELHQKYADDADCRTRFVLEAEITGSLEHPGIVPVYGFGHDAEKRPFYAMRFIRGRSLKTAIDLFYRSPQDSTDSGTRTVEFRKLLGRFVDVCQAIQYAHSRGVIHRDIKPANIMLGEYGETLVVDWGLAKAAGSDAPGFSANLFERPIQPSSSRGSIPTQLGSVIGTPAYMSPEQAEGKHELVGPCSDIYSLGATLYTLLTGRRAFEQRKVIEILEAVRDGNFPRPRELRRDVPRALEAISLKAMALDPGDRYQSCNELVGDIDHWLADEPVTAHQETLLERTARWTRRHRTWMRALSAAVLVVAVVAVVAALFVNNARRTAEELADKNADLAQREAVARQEAVGRLKQARSAVDTWLTTASESMQYLPGVQHARRQLLEQAAKDYERFSKQENADPDLELERARTYLRLGDVRRILERPEESQQAYRNSIRLLQELQQANPARTDIQVELANAHTKLALHLASLTQFDEADALYAQAAESLRSVLATDPNNMPARDALATNRLNHGFSLIALGADDQAESTLVESIDQFEKLCEEDDDELRYRAGLATACSLLGQHQVNCGKVDEGAEHIRAALDGFSALVAAEPGNPTYLESSADTTMHLARVSGDLGDDQGEQAYYEQAAEGYEKLAGLYPEVAGLREKLAIAWTNLGLVMHERAQTKDADEVLGKALDLLVNLLAQAPGDPTIQQETLACRAAKACVLSDLGEGQAARHMFELVLSGYQSFVQEYGLREFRERLAVCRSQYAQVLRQLEEHDTSQVAFELAEASLAELIEQYPEISAYRDKQSFVQKRLGSLLWEIGDKEGARAAFLKARDGWQDLIAEDSQPGFLDHLAWFLVNCPDSEMRTAEIAVESARRAVDGASANAQYCTTLGAALFRQGDFDSAITALERVRKLNSVNDGRADFYLAMALEKAARHEEASEVLARAIAEMEQSRPGNLELAGIRREAEDLIKPATE